ncbi:DUF5067 domain-containing protein [Salinicoccus sesuvii]|uniref:DUF5067 domain-containing protein n=1 Tax=Salinicoccus sesuvii TaxID=868281 RepID=A0ABV7N3H9_9STAP
MSLRKYLLAGGLSTVLLLGACNENGDSEEESTEEETVEGEDSEEASTEEEATENESTDDSTESDEVSFSGEYGDYNMTEFGQYTMEAEPSEEETEEGAEEAGPTELVTIEFEFTNNSDVATSPQEAFGLDLAVRQMMEGGATTLENMTMDLPEDFEKSAEVDASSEMIESGETVTAVVAYGPVDPEVETVLQSRENPMADEEVEPLDYTIEMEASEGAEEETTEEDTMEDSEE